MQRRSLLALSAVSFVPGAVFAQQQQFINILTGGQSGVYYPLGVALSQIYAKAIPNVRSTAQVTKASAENLNLLQAGRGELALALADSVSDAWKGDAEAGFPKKLDKLRGLSATYSNYIQIVANADTSVKIVVVPAPADIIAKIGDEAYQAAVIPANTYAGQTADVATVAIPNFLVTHSGVSDELAYQMAKTMYDNIDVLYAAHNAAKVIKRENAIKGMPVPVHPGAARYYKEVGLMK